MNPREITVKVVDAVLSHFASPGEFVELEWNAGKLWAVPDGEVVHGCVSPWLCGRMYHRGDTVPVWLNGEPFENFPATDPKAEGDRDDDLTFRLRESACERGE